MKTNKLGNNSFVLSLNARMYVYTTKAKKQIQFHSYVVPYDGSCQPDTWRASCIKNVFWLVCLVSFTIFSLWPKLLFIERLLFTPKSFRKTKRGWYYFTLARICFSFYQSIGRMFVRSNVCLRPHTTENEHRFALSNVYVVMCAWLNCHCMGEKRNGWE